MYEPILTIPLPENETGEIIKEFVEASFKDARRRQKLEDYCSAAGRVARRLELMADGKVRMLPD